MSRTMSVGVVGPSHWTYMAAVMAEKLRVVVEIRRIPFGHFPIGVYADAQRFFELVEGAIGGEVAPNPPASANAHCIATSVVISVTREWTLKREDVNAYLVEVSNFTGKLAEARELDPKECTAASKSFNFYSALRLLGEADC